MKTPVFIDTELTQAMTTDRHFSQAGFVNLLQLSTF